MDCSFESMYKKLVAAIPFGKPKIDHNTRLQLLMLRHYVMFLRTISEVELPRRISIRDLTKISEHQVQKLKKFVFMVPRLKELPESQHGINRYRPVKELISFLVRLVNLKTGSCGDHEIKNLEKELRFLLTVLGDTSLMVCANEHDELKNLLAEFEDVANEAGSFVHSLLFLGIEMDDGISVALSHINLLKANIIKLSAVLPACMRRSAYTSRYTSVVDSLLVLDLLVRDLEDLKNNQIADVKDQVQTLHQGMLCLQSLIKDTAGSAQDQIKECYIQIGDLAHQAQHLIVSFMAGDAPPCYLINRLIHINHKIELCRIELSEITMKCKSGGLKVAKCFNKQMTSSSLRKRSNTELNDDIIGYEDKMSYILDHLVGGGVALQVISIFGMPGLGKTTLAKKLYSHPLVSDRFDKVSWCVVSQTYLKHNVLANILIHIASELCMDVILEMEEGILAERIHKTLKGRRYLIVMDDIWDSDVCDELLRYFPDDGNGSRILFTTRNKEVAPPDCIMYALPSLSDDQCWELLEKRVFDNQPCPPELVKSGWKLAESCRGMPLAAVVIAGILSTVNKEERVWEEVKRNLSLYIIDGGDNPVIRILKLSYDHLPQHLKLCFLYLGVFFVGQEIPARHMMNMWIAEGFIHGENQKNAAEEYLKELIDKSLVMVADRSSDGGPKTCLIHDLLRELCLNTYEEEKLTRFMNSKYSKNEKKDRLNVDMSSTSWMCWQYMRNRFGRHIGSSYQIDVPDLRLLRVLYFDCSSIYLTGIEYLVSLKYLVVPDLPPSIGNLVNLEYLRVMSNKMVSVYLSSTIMEMKKLKYLSARPRGTFCKDCNTSLTNKLEFLSRVLVRNVKDEKMLKCSPQLRRLKCFYFNRFVCGRIDLSFLTLLESLTVAVKRPRLGGLITMSLPPGIKKLTVLGHWNKLSQKTLSEIGRLENLEVFKLSYMYIEGHRWDTRDGEFQRLKYLRLHLVGSSAHFPKLQQLEVSTCYLFGGIPAEIARIPTMQIIGVDWLLKKSATRIEEQQRDIGNKDLTVVIRTGYRWYQRRRCNLGDNSSWNVKGSTSKRLINGGFGYYWRRRSWLMTLDS